MTKQHTNKMGVIFWGETQKISDSSTRLKTPLWRCCINAKPDRDKTNKSQYVKALADADLG